MMGVWFLSNAFGNKLAGWAAGFFSTTPLVTLFGTVTTVLMITAVVMFALVRPMRRLMGEHTSQPAVVNTRTGT
jgi:dipeptide/tripeptide permease